MKILTNISRLLVGSLLIVSGLIKANDPLGFAYKMEEYFSAEVLGIDWLIPYALSFALFICIFEIVLGIATLLGTRIILVTWAILLMAVFFGFLTFYSAYFDKVADCGCFGDAMKFTPWQSFTKDIVLLIFILIIFINNRLIEVNTLKQDIIFMISSIILIALFSFGVISWGFPVLFTFITFVIILLAKNFILLSQANPGISKIDWIAFGIPILFSLIFSIYTLMHLPIKDFRPFAVGKNIPEQMLVPEGSEEDVYETILAYKNSKTGEVKEYTTEDYPWDDSTWIWVSTENKIVKKGYELPIHDFSIISQDGEDHTEIIINSPNYNFLLIANDITKTNKDVQKDINTFAENCSKEGIFFIGLTASPYEKIDEFRHEVQAMYDYYITDELTLKTIIRSNPGLMLIKGGVIIKKWHYNDFPSFDEVLTLMNVD
ncbi:MAG: BT_3928 family protein [Bacteroidota bacterium]